MVSHDLPNLHNPYGDQARERKPPTHTNPNSSQPQQVCPGPSSQRHKRSTKKAKTGTILSKHKMIRHQQLKKVALLASRTMIDPVSIKKETPELPSEQQSKIQTKKQPLFGTKKLQPVKGAHQKHHFLKQYRKNTLGLDQNLDTGKSTGKPSPSFCINTLRL